MTPERIAQAEEDASVSAMIPGPTYPNTKAQRHRNFETFMPPAREYLTQYSAVWWASRESTMGESKARDTMVGRAQEVVRVSGPLSVTPLRSGASCTVCKQCSPTTKKKCVTTSRHTQGQLCTAPRAPLSSSLPLFLSSSLPSFLPSSLPFCLLLGSHFIFLFLLFFFSFFFFFFLLFLFLSNSIMYSSHARHVSIWCDCCCVVR